MFINNDIITSVKEKYGYPQIISFSFSATDDEYNRIKSSQKNNRNHDITLYIRYKDTFIVIAKHFYPKGLFRAPSGGINPGEDFITGAKREAREETGCEIELSEFLLQTEVDFVHEQNNTQIIKWRSFVFLADYISGDFKFTDTDEIREISFIKLGEFEKYSEIMRSTSIAGLHYRAALHDEVKKLL